MENRTAFDYLARFRPSSSDGRNSQLKSIPRNESEDFTEFLASWLNMTRTKITAPFITNLLESADDGYSQEQAVLFQTILEKEPVISAHLQTRMLAVLACDWEVRCRPCAAGDTWRERAGEISAMLDRAGFYNLLKHLLDAIATGYSGSAIVWNEGGAGIDEFKFIHPANWIFDLAGNPALVDSLGNEKPLAGYHPNQFVFHVHSMKPGIPSRGGLLRTLVWLYFFKHYAVRDRARFLERFGIPFMLGKIRRDDFDNDDIKNQILNSLAKMGADGVGVVTEGSDLEVFNPASQANNAGYQEWFNYIDEIYALTILGQLATSKEASGFSKGQAQENVRRDLLEADCRALMQTVNRQVLGPLERYRFGSEGNFEFVIKFEPKDDLKIKAEIVKLLAESGYAIDPGWIEATFGAPLVRN